ncbi:hypothetical protein GQ55_3G033300 [Panicum hallii var. hallii]|uniref:Uncharacterized protein n=2 Tax=Panicum hallii TaxID=206008 RepID=A0A2T7E5A1_9POAL|nr:hypothetical protein PAHAL_3G031000 [Panicum hallii]PUZ63009.1 hypothetical protein GQ55_3G033300 [Panicum hallii var. hallii]
MIFALCSLQPISTLRCISIDHICLSGTIFSSAGVSTCLALRMDLSSALV